MTIETDRLILRPLAVTDSHDLMRVFGDANVMAFSDDGVQGEPWVKNWIQEMAAQYSRDGYGAMAVVLRNTKRTIGYCGLFSYDDVDGAPEVEIGYRLESASWGNGYATEAVLALLQHGHALGLRRIVAMIDPENVGSVKVAKKAGMTYEKEIMMPGYDHSDHLYVHQSR